MVSYYMPADAAFLIALFFNHFNAVFLVNPVKIGNKNLIYKKDTSILSN